MLFISMPNGVLHGECNINGEKAEVKILLRDGQLWWRRQKCPWDKRTLINRVVGDELTNYCATDAGNDPSEYSIITHEGELATNNQKREALLEGLLDKAYQARAQRPSPEYVVLLMQLDDPGGLALATAMIPEADVPAMRDGSLAEGKKSAVLTSVTVPMAEIIITESGGSTHSATSGNGEFLVLVVAYGGLSGIHLPEQRARG